MSSATFPLQVRHSYPTTPQVWIILSLFVPCSLSFSFSIEKKKNKECRLSAKHCSNCWGFNHEQDSLSIFPNRTYNSHSNNIRKYRDINVHSAQSGTPLYFKRACHVSKRTSHCFISLVNFLSALGYLFKSFTYHHTSHHLPHFIIIRGPSFPNYW